MVTSPLETELRSAIGTCQAWWRYTSACRFRQITQEDTDFLPCSMPAYCSSGSGLRVAASSVRTAERNSTRSHIRQSSGDRGRQSMPDSAYTTRIGLDPNADWSEPVESAYFISACCPGSLPADGMAGSARVPWWRHGASDQMKNGKQIPGRRRAGALPSGRRQPLIQYNDLVTTDRIPPTRPGTAGRA